ncbi:MAG: DeoR/GlpR family DNA-binding transcription regulator [Pseudomonadota bacterium]
MSTLRQSEILRLVRRKGNCTIEELARQLKVSTETIRRNVKPLVSGRLVQKVHGGIVLPDEFGEPPLRARMSRNKAAKLAIAEGVADLISSGDSLIIDSGSTTAYVARALLDLKNLTVVTNSAYLANILAAENSHRIFLAGGEMRGHDGAAFGQDAITFLGRFEVDYAVLSVGAIHGQGGFLVHHLCEADFSGTAIKQAQTTVFAADSSKFDRMAPVKLCDLAAADYVVTDRLPSGELRRRLDHAEVSMVLGAVA